MTAYWTDWLQPPDVYISGVPVYSASAATNTQYVYATSTNTWTPGHPNHLGTWGSHGVLDWDNPYTGDPLYDHAGSTHNPFDFFSTFTSYTLWPNDQLPDSAAVSYLPPSSSRLMSGMLRVSWVDDANSDHTINQAWISSTLVRTNPYTPYWLAAQQADPFAAFYATLPTNMSLTVNISDYQWETPLFGSRSVSNLSSGPDPYVPSSKPIGGGWSVMCFPWGQNSDDPLVPVNWAGNEGIAAQGLAGSSAVTPLLDSWLYGGTQGDFAWVHQEGGSGSKVVLPFNTQHFVNLQLPDPYTNNPNWLSQAAAQEFCVLNGQMMSVYPQGGVTDGSPNSNQMIVSDIHGDFLMRPSRVRLKVDLTWPPYDPENPNMPPPLRMNQRDDGLRPAGHARQNHIGAGNSSSEQTGHRLKGKNTYG